MPTYTNFLTHRKANQNMPRKFFCWYYTIGQKTGVQYCRYLLFSILNYIKLYVYYSGVIRCVINKQALDLIPRVNNDGFDRLDVAVLTRFDLWHFHLLMEITFAYWQLGVMTQSGDKAFIFYRKLFKLISNLI